MIQATVDRLKGLCSNEQLMIVTNQSLVDPIAQQLPEIPRESIVGEPAKRDTAPCVGLAAALTIAKDPDATMIVMPADHVIGPVEKFQAALRHAAGLVEEEPSRIVTFGINPTYPAESFGYIERTESSVGSDGDIPTFKVARFREKPDSDTAKQFLDAGTFYWNAGIFIWKAQTILDALKNFVPDIHSRIQAIADCIGKDNFDATLQSEFCAINGTSIDYAVMERYENVVVVEAPFEWDDLGSWTAVPRQKGQDSSGNCIEGKHLGIETSGSIIRSSSEHLLVTVGMEDVIVVHTENATLVARKEDEAKIKEVVAKLAEKNWSEYL